MEHTMRLTLEQERQLRTGADYHWENFAHKPLNTFDLGDWVLSFPGDIGSDRKNFPLRYADYKININDLNTCPRYADRDKNRELWNDDSQEVMWLLGRGEWNCHIHLADTPVNKEGAFVIGGLMFGIAVSRFQNIDGVDNILNNDELQKALYTPFANERARLKHPEISPQNCFTKTIAGRTWAIIKARSGIGSPQITVSTAMDHRTAITADATITNAWLDGEDVPSEIEDKYLASFWDLLSQVIISPSQPDIETGTTLRTTPGEAEPEDNGGEGW